MFGGKSQGSMVVRKPGGIWRSSAAQHSQPLESWCARICGVVVVLPSTPQDDRSMTRAEIEADDPVVYLEHENIRAEEGEVDEAAPYEWGTERIRRRGGDLTILSWSDCAGRVEAAVPTVAAEGIEAEVIDLRRLKLWDRDAALESGGGTGAPRGRPCQRCRRRLRRGGRGRHRRACGAHAPPRAGGHAARAHPLRPNLEDQLRLTAEMIADAAREACR